MPQVLRRNSKLYKAAIAALGKYKGHKITRGTGKGPTVPDPDGGPDWKLVLPMYEPLPLLIRLTADKQWLEYRRLPVK